ncbi:MAG: 2,3-dimethylmalate lyase [Alphaproteobacteria bacterium MarineAlpha2_Bin1]|nr:MAG: 2,3-dimethylmalate lyase [Alphaproteobacteria bacterium MarineAlpha2_Bin1]|tara:strand:+ start:854 stop:1714 length:861 start_codon:yes stop_codon:yes gene_type:complete
MKKNKLEELIQNNKSIIVPGGGTALELRLAELAGFEAGYVSGYATAAAAYGVPDVGLIALNEIETNVIAIRGSTSFPLIVDCDTGYGDIPNVMRTVQKLETLGVSAIQLEDQKWPKKCGHMEGKLIEPIDIAVEKIKAAVYARKTKDFKIIARTDARSPHGFKEAMKRLEAYNNAGADILFMDAIETEDEMKIQVSELPGVHMVNMSETGKTPLMPANELEDIGYKIILFPSSMIRIITKQLSIFLSDLRELGDSSSWLDRMASLEETNLALGLEEINNTVNKLRS